MVLLKHDKGFLSKSLEHTPALVVVDMFTKIGTGTTTTTAGTARIPNAPKYGSMPVGTSMIWHHREVVELW
jgi:hypothetical protein